MLFGISLLFGMTGTGDIVLISSRLGEMFSQGDVYPLAVLLSITFILAGVATKSPLYPSICGLPMSTRVPQFRLRHFYLLRPNQLASLYSFAFSIQVSNRQMPQLIGH